MRMLEPTAAKLIAIPSRNNKNTKSFVSFLQILPKVEAHFSVSFGISFVAASSSR